MTKSHGESLLWTQVLGRIEESLQQRIAECEERLTASGDLLPPPAPETPALDFDGLTTLAERGVGEVQEVEEALDAALVALRDWLAKMADAKLRLGDANTPTA